MPGNGSAFAAQNERLQARLAEPRTAEALERLLDKLEVVAFSVDMLDSFLHRSQEIADSLAGSLRDLQAMGGSDHTASDFVSSLPQLARAGTQVAAATGKPGFQNLLESGLIDQLGDPRMIANIQAVLEKLELAAFALNAVDGFLRRGDEVAESIGRGVQDVRGLAETIDFEKLKDLPAILEDLGKLHESGALEQLPKLTRAGEMLIDSGLLRPDVVATLAETGQALSDSYLEAKSAPAKSTSLPGIIKALRDPDTNRSLTFLLEVAKRYGQKMRTR